MTKKILMWVLLLAPLTLSAQKFAQFDFAQVVQSLPEYKTAQTQLEEMAKKFDADLQEMQKELQTKADKYKAEVNEQTPANIRQRREQELQDLYQRYQQAGEDNSKAFEEAKNTKMNPIQQKVVDTVTALAKEGGYTAIFDKTAAQANLIFFNDALTADVTAQVLAKLGISGVAAARPGK